MDASQRNERESPKTFRQRNEMKDTLCYSVQYGTAWLADFLYRRTTF